MGKRGGKTGKICDTVVAGCRELSDTLIRLIIRTSDDPQGKMTNSQVEEVSDADNISFG